MYLEFNKTGLVSDFQDTKQKETQIKIDAFYNWFKNLGGNLASYDAEALYSRFSCESLSEKQNFKSNPEDTKQKFNHKFNL